MSWNPTTSSMWKRARALLADEYPNSQLRIGFFGVPNRQGGRSHLVDAKTVPLCGQPVSLNASFALVSKRCCPDMVECGRCLRKLRQTVREATA